MTGQAAKMIQQDKPLWVPDSGSVKKATLTRFMEEAGMAGKDYDALWRWSVDKPEAFWSQVWDFCGVIGEKGSKVLENGSKMPGAQFFPQARLNFAENLLRRRDDHPAIIFRAETGSECSLSFNELYDHVSRFAQALRAAGVTKGDRVAGYLPNMPAAVIAMLATASLGGIWSSASPDFGVQGVLDRFGQIEPKVLVAIDGYFYNGKVIASLDKVRDIAASLPSVRRSQ